LTTIDRPHPTPILRKKIEDLREAGATFVTLRRLMRIVVRLGVGDDFRNG